MGICAKHVVLKLFLGFFRLYVFMRLISSTHCALGHDLDVAYQWPFQEPKKMEGPSIRPIF